MSTARNALWAVLQFGAGRFIVFASTVVLARLLEPEAFGLLAIGMLAINVFDRMKDLGVGPAVVQSRSRWNQIAPTASTLTALSSVFLGVVCFVSAPHVAYWLSSEEEIPDLLRGLSAFVVISGFSVIPDSALRRRMQFAQRTIPELVGAVVKAAISILLAALGFSVWSLVYGQLLGSAVTTALYWRAYWGGDRPPELFGWSTTKARELTRFGVTVSWLSLVALVLDNVDYFAIGHRLGATQLGYYTLAFRLPEMLVIGVVIVIGQVLFASFSRTQGDLVELRRLFLSASTAVATLTVPLGLGLAAAAGSIVPTVLGNQYGPAVPLLRALGIYATVYALSFHAGEVYKALGRLRILHFMTVVKAVVLIPIIWIAAGHSTLAVAVSFAGCHVLLTLIRLFIVRRVLHLSVADQLASIGPALTAGTIMAGTVLLLDLNLHTWPAILRLVLQILIGAATYLLVLLALSPSSLYQLAAVIRPKSFSDNQIDDGRARSLSTLFTALGHPRATVLPAANGQQLAATLDHDAAVLPQLVLVLVDSARASSIRQVASRRGWQVRGVFSPFPSTGAPAHLVALDADARHWYATGPRPVWGTATRLGVRLSTVPGLGALTLPGVAMLLSRTGQEQWPGSPDGAQPWVVHLGESNAAGRVMLSYGQDGHAVCHVRLEAGPTASETAAETERRGSPVTRETAALQLLATVPNLAGRVPTVYALPTVGAGSDGLAQSNIDGELLNARWRRDPTTVIEDSERTMALLAQVAAVPIPAELWTQLPATRPLSTDRLPTALTRLVLCHGDAWPKNVVWNDGPHLIDWESAHLGAPLSDPVMFAVTTLQTIDPSLSVAAAVVELDRGDTEPARSLRGALTDQLHRFGPRMAPREIWRPALRHAITAIANQVPPGGRPNPTRKQAWLDALPGLAGQEAQVPSAG